MRRIFIIISFLIALASCGKESIKGDADLATTAAVLSTKSSDMLSDDFFVAEKELQSYIHFLETIKGDKPAVKVVSYEPVEESGALVYYILNFENGWQLVSADKRGPVVLGSSDSGSFCLEERNPAELSWIAGLTDDIAFRRDCADDYYGKITPEAMESEKGCLDFWKAITADPEFLESNIPATKSHPSHSSGHWELMYSIPTEIRDSIPHLLPTRWHQNNPYNTYCPQISETDSRKCAVGCTAIAVAQVLYYLHYFLGVPDQSPTQGYCIGWVPGFSKDFSNYSSMTWNYMEDGSDVGDEYKWLFIGDVAHKIGSHFGEETWAFLADAQDSIEDDYGVSSTRSLSYDKDVVFDNLRRGLPVIFRGGRYVSPFVYSGHAFVIDGYESTRTQYRLVYWWVYDDLPSTPGIIGDFDYPGNLIEYDYSTPVALNFRLNWGYGDTESTILNAKYSTDGIWSYQGRTPYQYNRRMLYDFEASN